MLKTKDRCIVFGIGFILGCLILLFTYLGKYRATQIQRETDFQEGYSPIKQILPGHDLSAKKPYHTGPAMAVKDFPLRKDNTFLRVIIAKGPKELWRIEETIWKDPQSFREKLVSRQIMHPDRLLVRLKTDSDVDQLSQFIQSFNIKLIRLPRSSNLYHIQLLNSDIDIFSNTLDLLNKNDLLIEKAFPDYIDINS